jgi:6-pyruvoyltetrahydropterin/6-carboxytetrahydropterin synthase
MLVDFGLLKGNIHDFIDSFDHSYLMWNKEEESFKEFFWKNNARVIELPHSPSAEMLSLMFFFVIDKIIQNTNFHNGEGNVDLVAVRIHETETGYAESCRDDLRWWKWELFDIHFSVNIFNEWKDQMWWINLINKIRFSNPFVELHSQYQDE